MKKKGLSGKSRRFQDWIDNPPKNVQEPEFEKFVKCKKCKKYYKPSIGHDCPKDWDK